MVVSGSKAPLDDDFTSQPLDLVLAQSVVGDQFLEPSPDPA